jgi:hypothetical protein
LKLQTGWWDRRNSACWTEEHVSVTVPPNAKPFRPNGICADSNASIMNTFNECCISSELSRGWSQKISHADAPAKATDPAVEVSALGQKDHKFRYR